MRHRMKPRGAAGALGLAVLIGALALSAPPAHAAPKGMPLILPAQSLPLLRQMNRATNFNVMRVSQVALGNAGAVAQMAVVDVRQRNRQFNRGAPVPLFLLARDVPLIQQLNQGANINVLKLFQAAIGNTGRVEQVALVNVAQTNNSLNQIRPTDFLGVFPVRSLPTLVRLNTQTNFNVVRVSQLAAGNFGDVSQTALVDVQQQNGIVSPAQPFPMFVPAQDVPALRALNIGVNVNIVNIFQVAIGNTGPVTQVALVNLTQNNQVLDGFRDPEDRRGRHGDDRDDDDDDR